MGRSFCFPPRRLLHAAALLAALSLLPVASGCAHREAAPPVLDKVVWPPPPLEPRVAFVQSIRNSSDAGIAKGFFARVSDLLFGEEVTRVSRPYGIHVDGKKRIIFANTGTGSVHVIDRGASRYGVVTGPEGEGFLSPIGVTEDPDENVYVTDSAAGKVYRFHVLEQKVTSFIASGLQRPTGIVYNPVTDLIYVTDTVAGQVVAFTRKGEEALRFGTPGSSPGQFNRPTDIAVDAKGGIVVTDPLNGRIQIFTGRGTFVAAFGQMGNSSGTFAKPKGVAVDSSGNLHVCDALFDTVQLFNVRGELLLSYGTRGGERGELWMPSGLYIDGGDAIYVADTYNDRIQVFQYLRDVTEN